MRYCIFLLLLIVCSCGKSRKKENVNGIWIPEVVDWKDGGFDTYYINEDTVVIITSEQKLIHDSIYFRTEPGINVKKGILNPIADHKYLLPYRTLYRFIKLPGTDANDVVTDTISVVPSNDAGLQLNINGKNFIQGKLYTHEARKAIISIATKMVPELEKHPEEFD